MSFPKPPEKIVPFNSGPVAPHDIGRQFDEHRRGIAGIVDFLKTIIRDDGVMRESSMPPPRRGGSKEPTLPVGVLGPNAGGFYAGDDKGATATSADYAQVCIDWAEHMPDTIPPNTLAINAITGDHWSSRWWANRSANAFGMLAWWYQGAFPSPGPPTTPLTSTGQPLPVGAMYYNTTIGAMEVWTGTGWTGAANMPSPAMVSSLYYNATAAQTVFPLSVVDLNGKTFAFTQTAPEGLAAHVNGLRLETAFDFTVNVATSTVTFLNPLSAGAKVIFDLLAVPPTGIYLPLTGGTMTGNLFIAAPAALAVSGVAGTNRQLIGETSGSARWAVVLGDVEPEAGANAGSEFLITRFDDAGHIIDSPLVINRASAAVTMDGALIVAGAVTLQNTLNVNGGAGVAGVLYAGGPVTFNSTLAVAGGATFSSLLTAAGGVSAHGVTDLAGYVISQAPNATSDAFFALNNSVAGTVGTLSWDVTSNAIFLQNTTSGAALSLRFDGSASFSGGLLLGGGLQALTNVTLKQTSGDYTYTLLNGAGTFRGSFGCLGSQSSAVGVFTSYATGQLYIDTSGNFYYANGTGTAVKIGGGSWTAASDARIKTVVGEYTSGLDDVLQLRPVVYTYKGNDTPTADVNDVHGAEAKSSARSAPYPASMHFNPATDGTKFVGFIAQELETVFPDMVSAREGYIDGQKVTDLRDVDTTELIFALVNAVKELSAKVTALEAKP